MLSIDIETYSDAPLKSCGLYRYAEHPSFEILLLAYAYNDDPVRVIDLANREEIPTDLYLDIINPDRLKSAWNAAFERVCFSNHFGVKLNPKGWDCSMAKAAQVGLPMSLDMAAKALKIQAKLETGKMDIKFFTMPCRPTLKNGQRTRNLPQHDPVRWEQFKDYAANDVVIERNIKKHMKFMDVTPTERAMWILDQNINDRGVRLDLKLVKNAIKINDIISEKLMAETKKITGLDNANSPAQLRKWLGVDTLNKESLPNILANATGDRKRVVEIRQELSKTSISKYTAMLECVCRDGRARGLFQYCGASRTGRWSGRLIQLQNLIKNTMPDIDTARDLVRNTDADTLDMLYNSVPSVLSQLIRTAIVPDAGTKFKVSDFAAIEARVIAWIAGEAWRMDVFNTHGKIYEASAAQMFKVPLESIVRGGENYELRSKGKVAELALGYQGGAGALIQMGALKMGLREDELQPLVNAWRRANPKIVALWNSIENLALDCVDSGRPTSYKIPGCSESILFSVRNNTFMITLPSGRSLCYHSPSIRGGEKLIFKGANQLTRQWETQDTYGGKLVENIVQALARDCLAQKMLDVDAAGFNLVMHVHDELVAEDDHTKELDAITAIMSTPISWAPNLPLSAASFETSYYKKED